MQFVTFNPNSPTAPQTEQSSGNMYFNSPQSYALNSSATRQALMDTINPNLYSQNGNVVANQINQVYNDRLAQIRNQFGDFAGSGKASTAESALARDRANALANASLANQTNQNNASRATLSNVANMDYRNEMLNQRNGAQGAASTNSFFANAFGKRSGGGGGGFSGGGRYTDINGNVSDGPRDPLFSQDFHNNFMKNGGDSYGDLSKGDPNSPFNKWASAQNDLSQQNDYMRAQTAARENDPSNFNGGGSDNYSSGNYSDNSSGGGGQTSRNTDYNDFGNYYS